MACRRLGRLVPTVPRSSCPILPQWEHETCLQVGRQPVVSLGWASNHAWYRLPILRCVPGPSGRAPASTMANGENSGPAPSRLVSRSHGAPHSGQLPRSEVPARIIGSISFGGNVAKWASGYGAVATLHTLRLLRVAVTARKALRPGMASVLPLNSPRFLDSRGRCWAADCPGRTWTETGLPSRPHSPARPAHSPAGSAIAAMSIEYRADFVSR